MAVIGSIRKRTGLVIGVIAVALLMFLLMDALSSNSMMGGASGQNVGKINGKKIDYMRFQKALGNYEERIYALYPQAEIGPNDRANFRDEVWNDLASDILLGNNFEKMGLNVTNDEVGNAIFGDNIHFFARTVFGNPQTGQYDTRSVAALVDQAKVAEGDDPQKRRIRHLEQLIVDERQKSKYTALFSKGIYVPDFMAKDRRTSSYQSANVSYVSIPYTSVEDSEITYTDKDLQNYIQENEDKFKQEATREVKFYTIDIIPSVEDTADAKAAINAILEDEFKPSINDSLTVRRFSDVPYTGRYLTKEELANDPNVEGLFSDDLGTFYGPYFYDGSFHVAKLKDRKLIPDSVSARHILLVPTTFEQVDSLRALADSIIDLIETRKSNFDEMALTYSQDQSNAANGGDLGFFKQGVMVPSFNDACFFEYEEGDIFTVDSQFGIHIIRIDKAKPVTPTARVAVISQVLDYSKDTERELFREVNNFRTEHGTPEEFKAAEGEFLINTVSVTQNQVSMLGLNDARDIIKWAFTEKVGEIDYFDLEDKYIVAMISGEKKEGVGTLDDLRVQVEQAVKNEKKAEVLASRINAGSVSNINEVASATGTEVKSLPNLTPLSVSIEGSGNESDVVGHVFGMTDGQISSVLEGSNGVYVIQMNTLTNPGAPEGNYAAEKGSMRANVSYQTVLKDLMDDAKIDDTRYLFY